MMQRRPKWNEVAAELARRKVAATSDSDTFWRDFEARRHLYPQPPPSRLRPAAGRLWLASSLTSLAAAAIVVAAWFIFLEPTSLQAYFAIHSYTVTGEHSSIMLWQDEASQTTILWINDLEPEEEPLATEEAPVAEESHK